MYSRRNFNEQGVINDLKTLGNLLNTVNIKYNLKIKLIIIIYNIMKIINN